MAKGQLRYPSRALRRVGFTILGVVGLLIASIAIVLGAFWIAQAVRSAMIGDVPAMVAAVGRPTNVAGVLDL